MDPGRFRWLNILGMGIPVRTESVKETKKKNSVSYTIESLRQAHPSRSPCIHPKSVSGCDQAQTIKTVGPSKKKHRRLTGLKDWDGDLGFGSFRRVRDDWGVMMWLVVLSHACYASAPIAKWTPSLFALC